MNRLHSADGKALQSRGFADLVGQIAVIAGYPDINVKISGIAAYGPSDWTQAALQPYVDQLLATFDPGRIVWGSDSPVCTLQSSLAAWVATTHALLGKLANDERDLILSGNAKRIWLGQ